MACSRCKRFCCQHLLDTRQTRICAAPQLLACIGEQFTEGDEICGIVVNLRGKQDKICLWTKDAANEAAQVNVGKQFKDFLEYDQKIGFLSHVRFLSQVLALVASGWFVPMSLHLRKSASHYELLCEANALG